MAGGESGEYEILLTRHTGQMAECAWHITWTVQEFWGFKTTLTLTPISYGGTFPTPTEKGSRAEASAPPVNHSVQGLLWLSAPPSQLWAAEHNREQSSKLCSFKMEPETSQPILSLLKGKRNIWVLLHTSKRRKKNLNHQEPPASLNRVGTFVSQFTRKITVQENYSTEAV